MITTKKTQAKNHQLMLQVGANHVLTKFRIWLKHLRATTAAFGHGHSLSIALPLIPGKTWRSWSLDISDVSIQRVISYKL